MRKQDAVVNEKLVEWAAKKENWADKQKRKETYYRKAFARINSGKPSWNFAAFFLGFFWLVYHKMYEETIVWILLSVVFQACSHIFSPGIVFLVEFVGWVGLGFTGNWLLQHSLRRKKKQGYASIEDFIPTNSTLAMFGFFLFLSVIIGCLIGLYIQYSNNDKIPVSKTIPSTGLLLIPVLSFWLKDWLALRKSKRNRAE
jgi:hypothetical protein